MIVKEKIDTSNIKIEKLKNILVVCKSETDRILIKSIFKKSKNYKFFEANDLKTALKNALNNQIDLILIDDILQDNDGYEVVDRLNHYEGLKKVPKMIFMTKDYKSKNIDNKNYIECNFVKKPYDNNLLKSRIEKILNTQSLSQIPNSPFEHIIDKKLSDLKELSKVYKKFLDIDENILFLYDKDKNCAIDANKVFYNFFGSLNNFNRVLSSDKLIRKFIPKEQEEIYLNFYSYKDWHELLTLDTDFSFTVRILKEQKVYSFNIFLKNVNLFDKDIYLVKLSNIYSYISKNNRLNIPKIDSKIKNLKDDLFFIKKSLNKKNKSELDKLLGKVLSEFDDLKTLIQK